MEADEGKEDEVNSRLWKSQKCNHCETETNMDRRR